MIVSTRSSIRTASMVFTTRMLPRDLPPSLWIAAQTTASCASSFWTTCTRSCICNASGTPTSCNGLPVFFPTAVSCPPRNPPIPPSPCSSDYQERSRRLAKISRSTTFLRRLAIAGMLTRKCSPTCVRCYQSPRPNPENCPCRGIIGSGTTSRRLMGAERGSGYKAVMRRRTG